LKTSGSGCRPVSSALCRLGTFASLQRPLFLISLSWHRFFETAESYGEMQKMLGVALKVLRFFRASEGRTVSDRPAAGWHFLETTPQAENQPAAKSGNRACQLNRSMQPI
jgi:hypothetical protein